MLAPLAIVLRAIAFVGVLLLVYLVVVHWGDDRHPLMVDARSSVTTPLPGEVPLAIPDPNALFAPCPMMPRNVPTVQKRVA